MSSVISAPLIATISSPLKLLMPNPMGVTKVTVGIYRISRHAIDTSVQTNVIKVAVEDLARVMAQKK